MHPFEIDGRPYALNQLKIDLPELDLIGWLSNQPLYPKVYWKEKDGQITRAAVGNLLSFPIFPVLIQPLTSMSDCMAACALRKTNLPMTIPGEVFPIHVFGSRRSKFRKKMIGQLLFSILNEKPYSSDIHPVNFRSDGSTIYLLNRQEVPIRIDSREPNCTSF